MSPCLSSRLSSQLTRHSPAIAHSVLFPYLAPAVFAQSSRTVQTAAGIQRGDGKENSSSENGIGIKENGEGSSEKRENGVPNEDGRRGGVDIRKRIEERLASIKDLNSVADGYPESQNRPPEFPVEWLVTEKISIDRKDLLRDNRHRKVTAKPGDGPRASFSSSDMPPQLFWREEDDAPGLYRPYPSSLHLKESEVGTVHNALDARRAQFKEEDQALDRCIGQYGVRMTTYLYPYIQPAVQAMGRKIKEIEDEIALLVVEKEQYRHHRAAVRWLLYRGRTADAISQQVRLLPEYLPSGYFIEVLGYVAMHRRAFRIAELLLEALATKAKSHEIGAMYSFLVVERLSPGLKSVNSPSETESGKLASALTELLNKLLAVRGPGKRIILTNEAVRILIGVTPTDMLSELYTTLVLAHGGEYKKAISIFGCLRIISRLCRPESGLPKWHAAFAILQTLDGDLLLHQRHSRNVMYMVLQAALSYSVHSDSEIISEILSFIGRNSPANWTPDRVLIHHQMSQALAALDGATLRRLFSRFVAGGRTPDMVTLNILHSYYKRIGDERSRRAIMTEALALARPTKEFATDMLHAMVLAYEPFDTVFREYRQHFRTDDLAHFGITAHVGGILPTAEQEALRLYKPDHVTLATMIQSYMRSTHSILAIWHVYSSYQRLITGRHAETRFYNIRTKLLKSGSFIPHIIMMALSRYRRGLPYAANILEDMLRPGAPVKADVYSWSIFLRALTRHGKQAEAEAVLQMMKQRSMTPNVVSWTTLLVGYVQSTDHEAVERVLQRMIQNGVMPNTQTWAAVIRGCFMSEDGSGDWRAGDAFRRMLDMGVEPDEHVHRALEGLKNRDKFEAGLSGETQETESVFEDGELSYPEVHLETSSNASPEKGGGVNLMKSLGIEEDPLAPRKREEPETKMVGETLKAAEEEPVVEEEDHTAWDEEARKQEEELRAELAKEQARIAEERRRETESMFEEGELTWAKPKVPVDGEGREATAEGGEPQSRR